MLFDTPGSVTLEHRTPGHAYDLGTIVVAGEPIDESLRREDFELLRTSAELTVERARIDMVERPPDKTLAFKSLMPLL